MYSAPALQPYRVRLLRAEIASPLSGSQRQEGVTHTGYRVAQIKSPRPIPGGGLCF